jgi:hypothetical protein
MLRQFLITDLCPSFAHNGISSPNIVFEMYFASWYTASIFLYHFDFVIVLMVCLWCIHSFSFLFIFSFEITVEYQQPHSGFLCPCFILVGRMMPLECFESLSIFSKSLILTKYTPRSGRCAHFITEYVLSVLAWYRQTFLSNHTS